MIIQRKTIILGVIAPLAAMGLAACSEEPEKTYETRTEDKSGGEFIVNDATSEGVEVELPTTAMTPVPPEGSTPTRGAEIMQQAE